MNFTPPRQTPRTIAFLFGIFTTLGGCVDSPADGHTVASRSDTIRFSGYHTQPDAVVNVQAFNFRTNRNDTVSTGRSSTTLVPRVYWNDDIYPWSAPSRVLGEDYWRPGRCGGFEARVSGQTVISGRTYGMYSASLERNAEGCTAENRNNGDWANRCSSPSSTIRTRDFSDAPRAAPTATFRFIAPTADCTTLAFYLRVEGAEWQVRGGALRLLGGATPDTRLSCSGTSRAGGLDVTCTHRVGSPDAVRSLLDQLRARTRHLRIELSDTECADSSNVSATPYIEIPTSAARASWSWWRLNYPECAPAPEPTPPPPAPVEGALHDITCRCYQETTSTPRVQDIGLNGCFDSSASASAVVSGAGFMCVYAANAIAAYDGVRTECGLVDVRSLGRSCARPGDWSRVR
ncbi:MAG: hypothetical protein KF901_21270 [Myxococcales bacterium]|nr:hypothetical protein [Myxococcales bacterium]